MLSPGLKKSNINIRKLARLSDSLGCLLIRLIVDRTRLIRADKGTSYQKPPTLEVNRTCLQVKVSVNIFQAPPVYNCSSGVVLGHSKIKMFSEHCSLYLGTLRKKLNGKMWDFFPKSKKGRSACP